MSQNVQQDSKDVDRVGSNPNIQTCAERDSHAAGHRRRQRFNGLQERLADRQREFARSLRRRVAAASLR
jgi:hypothetical protein